MCLVGSPQSKWGGEKMRKGAKQCEGGRAGQLVAGKGQSGLRLQLRELCALFSTVLLLLERAFAGGGAMWGSGVAWDRKSCHTSLASTSSPAHIPPQPIFYLIISSNIIDIIPYHVTLLAIDTLYFFDSTYLKAFHENSGTLSVWEGCKKKGGKCGLLPYPPLTPAPQVWPFSEKI